MKTFWLWLVTLFLFLSISLPLAWWTDRNLDFWLSYFADKPVDVPFWLSWLACLLGPVTVGMNLIGEIARLAV